jgi:hypothetical protein
MSLTLVDRLTERPAHRRNHATRRAGLSRVAEDLSAMRVTTPTPPPTTPGTSTIVTVSRRRKSRSPGSTRSRTDGTTIAAAAGKKRKSTASSSSGATNSMYAVDEMICDRGRKAKSKPKTQSRHAAENSTTTMEQSQLHHHRPSKKERSKSRDSRERRKQPLSETSFSGEKSGVNTERVESFVTTELSRVKKELDTLKKVRRYLQYSVYPC